jgi:hypothetical protein
MDAIQAKTQKEENVLSRLLRKLLNQKDETIRLVKIENCELKELIVKQQNLIHKLNDENTLLAGKISGEGLSTMKHNSLVETNSSLKQRLLVSQKQNSMLLQDLKNSQKEIKQLQKKISKI